MGGSEMNKSCQTHDECVYTEDMTTTTNQFGFPIQTCTRCKGEGHYSYNQVTGTRCFKCLGTKTTITPNAKEAWAAFQLHLSNRKEVAAKNLQLGDLIARNKVWCEVTNIIITDEACGWSIQNEVKTVKDTYVILTYIREGIEETFKTNGNSVMRRHSGAVDPTPFLAMIKQQTKAKK